MRKTQVTLAEIIVLHDNEFEHRYLSDSRRRPPRLETLAQVIRAAFPDLDVALSDWAHEPWVKSGRLRRVTGQVRHGKRLLVEARGRDLLRKRLLDYRSAEPYATSWDVVQWIAEEARRRKLD